MSKAKAATKPKQAAGKPKAYLVVRVGFEVFQYLGRLPQVVPVSNDHDDRPAEVPVRAFATREAAEEHARQRDAEIRATFPPPLFADHGEGEDAFAARLAERVTALGLPPIKLAKQAFEHGRQFREWWAEHAADMSHEQRAALWEPFAHLTFHRVKEIELEG